MLEKRREEIPPPLIFVDVSPAQESLVPPDKTEYYSDKNSLAANPNPTRNTGVPRIDGQQTDLVKTEDVLKTHPAPLQPSPDPGPTTPAAEAPKPAAKAAEVKPAPKPAPQPANPTPPPRTRPADVKTGPKPTPAPGPGDLLLAHPTGTNPAALTQADTPAEPAPADASTAPPKRTKPGTLAEARARHPEMAGLAGEKMRQEGGVRKNELRSSLDAKATPFGAYDNAIVHAVQDRWYDLLAERWYADDRKGKVVLQFHLNSDGSITEMRFVQNTVDLTLALLCESAIRDPSPYRAWPEEMRRVVGQDYREVTFTFYYR